MASASLVDQIVKSLSFEVEAVPQDENVPATNTANTANMTPMNVKIRVRKKHESDMEKGVMTVPKFGGAPERIRLISSDQTIMSFNVLMETEFERKGKKKPRKHFFGGCLGTQYDDEDDGPYVPSSTYNYNAKIADSSIASKSEGVLKQNFTLLKHQRNNTESVSPYTKHSILGKCKPGGCLDPPFGEDKYSYRPVDKDETFITSVPIEANKEEYVKILDKGRKTPSKTYVKGKSEDASILSISETDRTRDSVDTTNSDSIITYPPEVTSSQKVTDKFLRSRIPSEEKERRSIREGSEIFYSPAKNYRKDYKDRTHSHESSTTADTDKEKPKQVNRQKLKMRKDNTERDSGKLDGIAAPQYYTKSYMLSTKASLDQNDIINPQKTEMENNKKYDTVTRNNVQLISASVSKSDIEKGIFSNESPFYGNSHKTDEKFEHLFEATSVPLSENNNMNLKSNKNIKIIKTPTKPTSFDELHNISKNPKKPVMQSDNKLEINDEKLNVNEKILTSVPLSVDGETKTNATNGIHMKSEDNNIAYHELDDGVKIHNLHTTPSSVPEEEPNNIKDKKTENTKNLKTQSQYTLSEKITDEPSEYNELDNSDNKIITTSLNKPYYKNLETIEKLDEIKIPLKYTSSDKINEVPLKPKTSSKFSNHLMRDNELQKYESANRLSNNEVNITSRQPYLSENLNEVTDGEIKHEDAKFTEYVCNENLKDEIRNIDNTGILIKPLVNAENIYIGANKRLQKTNSVAEEDVTYSESLKNNYQSGLESETGMILPNNQQDFVSPNKNMQFELQSSSQEERPVDHEGNRNNEGSKDFFSESTDKDDYLEKYDYLKLMSEVKQHNTSNDDSRSRRNEIDSESIKVRDKAVNPTKPIEKISIFFENEIINKNQDETKQVKSGEPQRTQFNTAINDLTQSQSDMGMTYQSSEQPNDFTEYVGSTYDNLYPKEYDAITTSIIPNQYSLAKNTENTSGVTKSMNDIRYNVSSKSSISSTYRPYGKFGDSTRKETDYSPKTIQDITGSMAMSPNSPKLEGKTKSSLKNETILLNIGFQSYDNDKKERILKTIDTSKEPIRKPHDAVTIIRAQIRPQVNDLRIPIDAENEMSIQIRRNKSSNPLKVQINGSKATEATTGFTKLENFNGREMQEVLDSIYKRDLIPLTKAFKYLKQDLDILTHQTKFKDKGIAPKTSKTIRIVKVNPRCCCWNKF